MRSEYLNKRGVTIKVLLGLTLILLSLFSCARQATHALVTYNIRHGVGMDRVLDLERTARVLGSVQPDIIILNEVDNGTERSRGVLQTDSLANLLEMNAVFGKSIEYDGGGYGNALLSKYPILDFKTFDLSVGTVLEGRSVFQATLLVGPDTLVVMGTHLGLDESERLEQIKKLIEKLPGSTELILAGDFNFEPTSLEYELITAHLTDAILGVGAQEHTYPTDTLEKRIDFVFTGKSINVQRAISFNLEDVLKASDHRPQGVIFSL